MADFIPIARPPAGECSEESHRYVATVTGDDAWPVLVSQIEEVERRLAGLPEEHARHRYAPGKWSVKEVVGHLSDSERVYAYRALRFARNDPTPLPGFDENLYVPAGRFDARSIGELVDDWRTVRGSTLSLFRGLDGEALLQRGIANGSLTSVRALAWVAAGHARHHLDVLRDRYGIR